MIADQAGEWEDGESGLIIKPGCHNNTQYIVSVPKHRRQLERL